MDTSCTSSSCKQCRFAQEGIELLLPYVGQRISVLKEGPPKNCPRANENRRPGIVFRDLLFDRKE